MDPYIGVTGFTTREEVGSYAKHGSVNGEVSNNASGCSWYFS